MEESSAEVGGARMSLQSLEVGMGTGYPWMVALGGISFFDIFFAFASFLGSMCIVLIIRTKQRDEVKRKPVFTRIW